MVICYQLWSPKCAAITGVGVDMSPHCFIKCPNGSASTQPLAAKSKLYLLTVGLFALKADIWRLNHLL